ncbi:hypothetical protein [Phaeobacter gallaeciensis]|uniref:hypothetical protein n=1 Tax=Phaeobacter gallaeciensis TaxID=60890 RepID=UPI00237FB104|nr:hypothetical protein [Phaeobacter gallaeciensis]MDE4193341.1 hypothetical protein [Phaeobacter gallaeciensis]MDE4201603.1 hypothetical protein [Phaeobacter gallaeciensis]MDE4205787.1 hypothetical protein [Phaeobacter gallaeciensis]MDE4209890.1 hypothetical protein [Phaeobacter gallaeciensis]MDE4218294.1 hypothetical protein [Phaeobacter gallaeciensis]
MASYGPSDLGAVLQGVGALAQAAAIGFAAWMASNTYQSWRRQKLSERRIEQAERILTAAYKARRALGYVRSPLMEAHELSAAEAQLEKRDFWATVEVERKRRLVSAQGYYNRLNAVIDERRAVEECLPMARALFGEQVEKALELLNRQFHMVQISVDANTETGNDREFSRSIREDISSSSGTDRPNKMNELIEEQVKLIEDALVPVLRLEATQR